MKPEKHSDEWRGWSMSMAFDEDYAAWLKGLSRKQRVGEPAMSWSDHGPFVHTAYQLHCDLAGQYVYRVGKGERISVLPVDCTPEGLYAAAVACRRRHVGDLAVVVDTPWHRLSAYSQFLFKRMAERVARCAGFGGKSVAPVDDGLGLSDDLDDGL
jgi:hypothetical protein